MLSAQRQSMHRHAVTTPRAMAAPVCGTASTACAGNERRVSHAPSPSPLCAGPPACSAAGRPDPRRPPALTASPVPKAVLARLLPSATLIRSAAADAAGSLGFRLGFGARSPCRLRRRSASASPRDRRPRPLARRASAASGRHRRGASEARLCGTGCKAGFNGAGTPQPCVSTTPAPKCAYFCQVLLYAVF